MTYPLIDTLIHGWKRTDNSPCWFTLSGDSLDGLEWLDPDTPRPSDAEILAKQQEFEVTPPPQYSPTQFLIDIQQNAAWKTWVNSLPQHDALSLTGAALRENWTILKAAFDAAILEVTPSNAARSEWQTIANNNGIPVTFEAA